MRQVGTERNDNFILFLSHPTSTYGGLKWSHNGIFQISLDFFSFFLEFSISRWVGTKQNDNSYFLSFSASFNRWNEAIIEFFLFFELFCYFFLIFYNASGRNKTKLLFLFSLFLGLFQTILAWNDAIMLFFFGIFLAFSFNRFWLEMKR